MTAPLTVLNVTASARRDGSITRQLSDDALTLLSGVHGQNLNIIHRDVAKGLPFINTDWVTANVTADAERDAPKRATLALSDGLVAELQAADIVMISAPVYNFGVPATLKAWIDLVCRAGKSFRYTSDGPIGLLNGKRAIIITASGGTPIGSPIDFTTPYLRHIMGFIGIHDVALVTDQAELADALHVNSVAAA